MRWVITASGCDDSTTAVVELDQAEVAAVRKVQDALAAVSRYGCMPTLGMRWPATATDEEDFVEALREKAEEAAGD